MLKTAKATIKFLFSGTFGQFNIFIFMSLLFLCAMFWIGNQQTDPSTRLWTNGLLAVITIALFTCAFVVYLKKTTRSDSTATPQMKAQIRGVQVTLNNPPDLVFQPKHMVQLLRLLMSGYDEDLCADGDVIGQPQDGKVQMYTEEEKRGFKEQHLKDIAQARKLISSHLEKPDELA